MSPVLLSKLPGGIGLLTLNRPKALNTWTTELQQGLFDGLDSFSADPDVRIIVITGAGKGFCAGAALAGGGPGSTGAGKDGFFPDTKQRLLNHATSIPKPVIGEY